MGNLGKQVSTLASSLESILVSTLAANLDEVYKL